jgi:hypothetical protein
MKRFMFITTGLLLFSAYVSAQYLLKEDLFSITFPSEPTREVQDVETEGVGTIQMVTYLYEGESAAYMLAYSDYPIEHMQQPGLLDAAEDGFTSSLGIEVINEWMVSRDEYEGVYFQGEGESTYCVVKDYIVGTRLYQIAILQSEDYPSLEEIDKFIDSFNLNVQ